MTEAFVLHHCTSPASKGTAEVVEITPLITALCELRNAWRDGKTTFDVRVMTAVGEVIRQTENVIEFREVTSNG